MLGKPRPYLMHCRSDTKYTQLTLAGAFQVMVPADLQPEVFQEKLKRKKTKDSKISLV